MLARNLITTDQIQRVLDQNVRAFRGSSQEQAYRQLKVQQEQTELILSKRPICNTQTLETLRDRLGVVNIEDFQRLVTENFFDHNVMSAAFCVVEAILSNTNDSGMNNVERKRYFFEPVRQIGSESVFGYAISTDFQQAENLFILKAPRKPGSNDLLHEYIVGAYGTNLLRQYVPNFAYIFGAFECSAPIIRSDKQVTAWCNTEKQSVAYVAYENITPAVSIGEYVRTSTFEQFLNPYMQTLYALRKAQEVCDFTHYDLHDENVLVRDIGKEVAIPYETERTMLEHEYLLTDKIATLIDFGQAHIRYKDQTFGYFGLEPYSNLPDRSFPLFDAYKLLLMSMRSMLRVNNMQCFDGAARLLRFFNSTETPQDIIRNQAKFYYVLPRTPETLAMNLDSFLTFIRSNVSTRFIVENVDKNKILVCRSPACRTTRDAFNAMGVQNPLNANDVVEFYDLFERYLVRGDRAKAEEITKNFDHTKHLSQAKQELDTRIPALSQAIATFQPILLSKSNLGDLNIPAFVTGYIDKLSDYAGLVDEIQDLRLRNRAFGSTSRTFRDATSYAQARSNSTLLRGITKSLGNIFNQYQQDLNIVQNLEATNALYVKDVIAKSAPQAWYWQIFPSMIDVLGNALSGR